MNNVLLSVENVSKDFRIRNLDKSLRDRLCGRFQKCPDGKNSLKALENISFSLSQGDILGVIGPNGAGKTTLLKLVSGVLFPSSGSITRKGRLVSLLDLGLGFYPQLSGRENLYTFASLHNITPAEVDLKLPEILQFSGIHEFIELPIRFYSAGMNTRLAFAAFCLVEPEILLIDEIYQAGDIEFQQRSMEKIEELMKKSLAVVFVSHNLHLIKSLCNRAILLKDGKMIFEGSSIDTVNHYLKLSGEKLYGTTD